MVNIQNSTIFYDEIAPDRFLEKCEFYLKMFQKLRTMGFDDYFIDNCDITDLTIMYFRGRLSD